MESHLTATAGLPALAVGRGFTIFPTMSAVSHLFRFPPPKPGREAAVSYGLWHTPGPNSWADFPHCSILVLRSTERVWRRLRSELAGLWALL